MQNFVIASKMQNFVTVSKIQNFVIAPKIQNLVTSQKSTKIKKYSEMIKFRQKKSKFVPKTKIPTQKYKIQKSVFERAKRKSQKFAFKD